MNFLYKKYISSSKYFTFTVTDTVNIKHKSIMFNLDNQNYKSIIYIIFKEFNLDRKSTKIIKIAKQLFDHNIFKGTEFEKVCPKHHQYDINAKNISIYMRLNKNIKTEKDLKNIDFRHVGVKYSGMKFHSSYLGNTVGIPILKTSKILKPDIAEEKEILKLFKKRGRSVNQGFSTTNFIEIIKKYPTRVIYKGQQDKNYYFRYIDIKDILDIQYKDILEKAITKNKTAQEYILVLDNTVTYIIDKKDIQNNVNEIFNILYGKDIKEFESYQKIAKGISKTSIDENLIKSIPLTVDLFDHQKQGVTWLYNLWKHKIPGAMLADDMGMGKALKNGTPVKVPTGWTEIQKLKINDYVMGPDGNYTKVVGVYPQGFRETYKIIFDDGREIIADADHLWQTHSYLFPTVNTLDRKLNRPLVLKTKEIISYLHKSGKVYIPLTEPEIKNDIDLPCDPYLLGSLIGDGGFSQSSVNFSTCDDESILNLEKALSDINCKFSKTQAKYDYTILIKDKSISKRNNLKIILKNLGLFGHKSYTKFIPNIYKNASYEQKLELLRGLMDTDGYASKINGLDYSTSSIQLAKDVQELIWSIGGISKIKETMGKYKKNGVITNTHLTYKVTIRVKDPSVLVKLSRKQNRLKETQYAKGLLLGIKKIEKIDKKEECTCISVANKSKLFITKDYLVTHNTIQGIAFATATKAKKIVIVCPASVISVWEGEILEFQPKLIKFVKIYSYEKFIRTNVENCDLLIVDEVQKAKNKNLNNDALSNIKAKFNLLLSGTPIENKVQDVYNILHIVDPMFSKIYNMLYRITRDENRLAMETKKIIKGIYLRREKTEKQLKAKLIIHEVPVKMLPYEKEVHKKIVDFYGSKLTQKRAKNDLAYYNDAIIALMRLRQCTSYAKQLSKLDFLNKIKIQEESSKRLKTMELIKNSNEKWIIFTEFKETILHLKKAIPDALVISGDVPSGKRGEIIKTFQDDGTKKVIIVSLKAGNSGITLHAANNIIVYDLWWNPAVIQQAIARAYRIGQTRDVNVYMLANENSIDTNVLKIINMKKEIIDSFTKEGQVHDPKSNKTNTDELIDKLFK